MGPRSAFPRGGYTQRDVPPHGLTGWIGDIYDHLAGIIRKWGLALGWTAQRHEETLLALTDLPSPSEVVEPGDNIPADYIKHFDWAAPIDDRCLVGQEEELKTLVDLLDRWRSGKPCSAAIIGPEGSGKTTLINAYLCRIRSRIPTIHLQIDQRLRTEADVLEFFSNRFKLDSTPDSIERLREEFLKLPAQILIVEGGHNLMLRTIGGSQPAQCFSYLMMSTRAHLLWLVSMRAYPWRRMEHLMNISRYFTHQVPTELHDTKEIQEGLKRRHEGSGYSLLFQADGMTDLEVRRLLKSHPLESEAVQKALEKVYFEELFDLTGGNMQSALYFWLASIRYDPARKTMRVSPCIKINWSFFAKLDRLYMFTLAELIGNGGLTVEEHARIFGQDLFQSRMALDYLCGIRLVQAIQPPDEGSDTVYRMNTVFYHPVSRMLESRNILH